MQTNLCMSYMTLLQLIVDVWIQDMMLKEDMKFSYLLRELINLKLDDSNL